MDWQTDMDSKCPVTTEAYILKQTEVPYRRVEFCWNTKLQGANLNLAKWEKSHGVVLKFQVMHFFPFSFGGIFQTSYQIFLDQKKCEYDHKTKNKQNGT